MTPSPEPGYDASQVESEVLDLWERIDAFQQSIEIRRDDPNFVFLEGPPTANGLPHPGHVLTRAIKDSICRYKTMRGFRVERRAGWDCHGLPVEIEVEKDLGLETKQDVEDYGIAEFNEKCRSSVFRYKENWEWMSKRVGYWLDFDDPYVTLDDEYIESVWWSLKQAWDGGMLEKGHRVMPHCPRCDTALSSHEVAQGYKLVEDTSVVVKFPIEGETDRYLLAWTTTPWTLPGNVALAVGEDIEYVEVVEARAPDRDTEANETLILAAACLNLLEDGYTVVNRMLGEDLVGTRYEPLFSSLQRRADSTAPAWSVVAGDFVSTEDGSGIVHTAVMYGEDDFELGEKLGLPTIHTVGSDGRFLDFVDEYKDLFVKDAEPRIVSDLEARGYLYSEKEYEHKYPFCWRCDSPLIYYARESWFIRMTELREDLVQNNNHVNWIPSHMKDGRFGEFIRNVRDWSLSRDRFWGTPLPIWTCVSCESRECIGSIEDLKSRGGQEAIDLMESDEFDLHRPYVDRIIFTCSSCGDEMKREDSVLDAWYDSGAAPFAQWGYPHGSRSEFPVLDFVAEGLDQTRGWFYSLLAESTLLFNREAYKNVFVNGLLLDETGQKMSKSKKNYEDPMDIIAEYGADAVRWYLLGSGSPTSNKRFHSEAVREAYSRYILTLWNCYRFFTTYSELEPPATGQAPAVADRPVLDRWLVSRMKDLCTTAIVAGDGYRIHHAIEAIDAFVVNDLSNWWVRLSRRRFWDEEGSLEKASAYATMFEALLAVCKLSAPYTPFITESIFQGLRQHHHPQSIHHMDYPDPEPVGEMAGLNTPMDQIRRLAESVRRLRDQVGVNARQPLQLLAVVPLEAPSEEFIEMLPLLKQEANVNEVRLENAPGAFERENAHLNQEVIGREFRDAAKKIFQEYEEFDPIHVAERLRTGQTIEVAGFSLHAKHFRIERIPEERFVAERVDTYKVFLDTELDEELEAAGLAREVIRRIQEMRKSHGLKKIVDRIEVRIFASQDILQGLENWRDEIAKETLAEEIDLNPSSPPEEARLWRIDGMAVHIWISQID